MITIASQIQAASPPSQFISRRWRIRWPGGRAGRWSWVPVLVVAVVAMSRPLELASAAAYAAQEQGQRETDHHEDRGDGTGEAHLVPLEASDVHVQGEVAGGARRPPRREHEDEVEERQRSDDH